jgi:hypothetical protein
MMKSILILGYVKHTLQLRKKFVPVTSDLAGSVVPTSKVLVPDWQRFAADYRNIVSCMPYQQGTVVIILHRKGEDSQVVHVVRSAMDLRTAVKLTKDGQLMTWCARFFEQGPCTLTFELVLNG